MATVERGAAGSSIRRDAPWRAALLWVTPLALLALAFWPHYLRAPGDARLGVHLHAAAATLWVIALAAQATLIVRRRAGLHRAVGRVAFALAPLVLWTAAVVTQDALARAGAPLGVEALQTFALAGGGALLFGLAAALGFVHRRRAALHARLMALSGVGLAGAAVQRVLLFYVPGFGSLRWAGHGDLCALELLCAALLVVDHGRGAPRWPFGLGLGVLVANHVAFAWAAELEPFAALATALAAAPALAPWGGAG